MGKKITRQYLNLHRSINKGFTRYQIEALGLAWPTKRDWKKEIVGKTITDQQRIEFERGILITSKEYWKEKCKLTGAAAQVRIASKRKPVSRPEFSEQMKNEFTMQLQHMRSIAQER